MYISSSISGESFPPNIQGPGDNILPNSSYTEESWFMGSLNWASSLIPLGRLHLRPLQRHFHFRSEKPVCITMSIRPFSPCQHTQALAGPIFSHIWIPNPAFPGGVQNLGWGAHMGDFQISGIWTHSDRRLHINTLELTLALRDWVSILRGHQVMIAADNTTVVAFINKQRRTHSHTHNNKRGVYTLK